MPSKSVTFAAAFLSVMCVMWIALNWTIENNFYGFSNLRACGEMCAASGSLGWGGRWQKDQHYFLLKAITFISGLHVKQYRHWTCRKMCSAVDFWCCIIHLYNLTQNCFYYNCIIELFYSYHAIQLDLTSYPVKQLMLFEAQKNWCIALCIIFLHVIHN